MDWHATGTTNPVFRTRKKLKRAFLCKSVAGQSSAARALAHFYLDGRNIGRRQTSRTQNSVLGEHFVVHLGEKVVLAVSIVPPDLPKLNGLDRHLTLLNFRRKAYSDYRDKQSASIRPVVQRRYQSPCGGTMWGRAPSPVQSVRGSASFVSALPFQSIC